MQCPYCKEEIIDGAVKCRHCGSMIREEPPSQRPLRGEFETIFGNAARMWKENLGDLFILTLVFMLVVWIPIANVGFIAGYARSLLKVSRGQGRARVGDLFDAWDCFGSLFLFILISLVVGLVLNAVPFFGNIASIVVGFMVFPGAFLIVDRKAGAIDAFKWCFETIQADFANWLLAYIAGNVIIFGGALLFFIGIIFTAPLGELIFIQQYDRVKPGGTPGATGGTV